MDLRHLRYFSAIARAGTFGGAASALNLAQPALSRQIKDLETELGTQLLRRTPKGVIATAAGDALLAQATQLLEVTQQAVDDARRTAQGRAGMCTLAVGRISMAIKTVSDAVTELLEALPDVLIELQEVYARDQLPRIAEGTLDIGLAGRPSEETLTSEQFGEFEWGAALLATGHRLATRTELTPGDLAEEPIASVSPEKDPAFDQLLRDALARAGIRSPQEFVYASPLSIVMMVAAGRGWAPAPTKMTERPPEGTVVIPVRGFSFPFALHIVWRRGESRPVVLRVLEALRAIRDGLPLTAMADGAPALRQIPGLPPGLELRHLRYFAAVADEGGFGRAADQLGVTQPSLSRQVADLEYLVGAELLARSPRGVAPTDAGRALREGVRQVFQVYQATLATMRPARRGVAGRCVVGAVQTQAAGRVLGALASRCAERWPKIRLVLEETATPEQPLALREGHVDIGIAHAYPLLTDNPDLAHERLIEDAMDSALLARDHRFAGRPALEAAELADTPLLFMHRAFHAGLHDAVFGALRALGLEPRVVDEHDELHLAWALAAQGKGWVPGFRSHRHRAPAGLVAVPIRGFHLPWGLDLLWRRRETNPAVARVLEALREVRGQMADRGRATVSATAMNPARRSAAHARPGRPRAGPRRRTT